MGIKEKWVMRVLRKQFWSSLWAPKAPLNLYPPPPRIRSESKPPSNHPSVCQLNHPEPYHNLWWASFRSPLNEFIGVVICRGKSPGAAANRVIKLGIVESERANIVMIPVNREGEFIEYEDRLLDREVASRLLRQLDIGIVEN